MASTTNTPEPHTLAQRYARWVIRHRWAVLAVALVVTVAAAAGLPKLGLATDYRVFFSPDNPDLTAYEAVENVYTKNDNVLFVLQPRDGDIFTPRMLETLRSLTEDAWQIPYSTRVDGITNFQHTWADGDELIVEDLVGPGEITEAVATRARDVALASRRLPDGWSRQTPGRRVSTSGFPFPASRRPNCRRESSTSERCSRSTVRPTQTWRSMRRGSR